MTATEKAQTIPCAKCGHTEAVHRNLPRDGTAKPREGATWGQCNEGECTCPQFRARILYPEYTPGNWEAWALGNQHHEGLLCYTGGTYGVVTDRTQGTDKIGWDEGLATSLADARLIALAPAMAEAIEADDLAAMTKIREQLSLIREEYEKRITQD